MIPQTSVSGDIRRLFANFFSLSSVEGLNYILPLLTLPYLVRILGPGNFGKVAFAQAFIQYLVIVTDFGFYLSAPKNIATNIRDRGKIQEFFSAVFFIKIGIMCFAFVALLLLVSFVGKFGAEKVILLISFSAVVGDIVFPTWFFQGVERMRYITVLYFLARAFFVAAIFGFVKSAGQYVLVPLFQSLGLILAGLISFWIIGKKFGITLTVPSRSSLLRHWRQNFSYFVSTISTSLYTNSGTFILGLVAPPAVVGYYSAGEKCIRAIQRMHWAASQSVYPYVSKLATASRQGVIRFLRRYLILVGGTFFLISLGTFFLAANIVRIILGPLYGPTVSIMQVLAFIPFIASISNVFGIQTMLVLNMVKAYARIMLAATAVGLIVVLLLALRWQGFGVSMGMLVTEILIGIALYLYLNSRGINMFGRQRSDA